MNFSNFRQIFNFSIKKFSKGGEIKGQMSIKLKVGHVRFPKIPSLINLNENSILDLNFVQLIGNPEKIQKNVKKQVDMSGPPGF